MASVAAAGTPLPTEDLGSSGPIDYLRTKYPQVVTQAGATTTCESGTLTGGGAAISGSGKTSDLSASGPVTDSQAWLAEGRTTSQGGETVTTWAMCGPGAVTRSGSNENFAGNTAQLNLSIPCPGGEVPLSPGIVGTAGKVTIMGMFPANAPNAWTFSMASEGAADAEAGATSLCSGSYVVETRTAAKEVEEKKPGKATAKCKKREAVVGGGLQMIRGTVWQQDVTTLAARPWDSPKDAGKTPDDGYYAKSFNGTKKTVILNAYAVCTPRNAG